MSSSVLSDIKMVNKTRTANVLNCFKNDRSSICSLAGVQIQCVCSIPNFKNFLSLHIFVQSLAEQQHALKISEHTLIIMCNNKTGYN